MRDESSKVGWPRLTLASGPVDVPQETLGAIQRPVLYHYDPAFIAVFERVTGLLAQVFQTRHDVVIMQGEAVLALEAAAARSKAARAMTRTGRQAILIARRPRRLEPSSWGRTRSGADVLQSQARLARQGA